MSLNSLKDLSDVEYNDMLHRIAKKTYRTLVKQVREEVLSGAFKNVAFSDIALIYSIAVGSVNGNVLNTLKDLNTNKAEGRKVEIEFKNIILETIQDVSRKLTLN